MEILRRAQTPLYLWREEFTGNVGLCHGEPDENFRHLLGPRERRLILPRIGLGPHWCRHGTRVDKVHLDLRVRGLVGIGLGKRLERSL